MVRLLVALFALVTAAAPALAEDWQTYTNPKFGTTITYPADIFTPEPESANGDGRRFVSADGRAEITVYGGYNVDRLSLKDLLAAANDDAAPHRVTYQTNGPRWFVMSGFEGDRIFYRKLMLTRSLEVAHTVEIIYPASEKSTYDRVTTRVSKSLTWKF
ncbi:hypothetical protein [Chthonobacter rhizosphaerae]|uniref:hypothetical protein n=1 Tax=Chthonobacter rhizosphaerae TaxID=2735553 RepID=UPI0015EE4060|nr:hypothetical protein [Chthonobacter rhizosphaerae]